MTVLLVRHAHAGDRGGWPGDDTLRPLSEKGRNQARLIADYCAPLRPMVLRSSPAVRCMQTLEPLGSRLAIDVTADNALFEGQHAGPTLDLIDRLAEAGTTAVLCSHGDIIPEVIRLLSQRGMRAATEGYQKAGVWRLEFEAGQISEGIYVPAPRVEGATSAT